MDQQNNIWKIVFKSHSASYSFSLIDRQRIFINLGNHKVVFLTKFFFKTKSLHNHSFIYISLSDFK